MKRLLAAMMTVTMLICLCQGAFAESGVEDGVLTVAMDVGFSNVSYFNRLFKKKFRMTPLEYRKRGEKR